MTEIDKVLCKYARAVSEVEERELMTHSMMRKEWGILLEKVKRDLSDLGVVIKVDRELPRLTISVSDKFHPDYADMSGEWVRPDDNCVAVEPLIKEK